MSTTTQLEWRTVRTESDACPICGHATRVRHVSTSDNSDGIYKLVATAECKAAPYCSVACREQAETSAARVAAPA